MAPPSSRSGRPGGGSDGARPRREPRHVVPAIETRAELVWVDRLRHASYAGVLFLEAVTFEDSFLAMLMRRSGGEQRLPLQRWDDGDGDQLWLEP